MEQPTPATFSAALTNAQLKAYLAAKSHGWRPRDVPAAACDGSAVAAHACVGVQYSRIVYWDGYEELVSYSCIVCADGANYSLSALEHGGGGVLNVR